MCNDATRAWLEQFGREMVSRGRRIQARIQAGKALSDDEREYRQASRRLRTDAMTVREARARFERAR